MRTKILSAKGLGIYQKTKSNFASVATLALLAAQLLITFEKGFDRIG